MGLHIRERGVFDIQPDILPGLHLAARGLDPAGDLGNLRLSLGHLLLAFRDLGFETGHCALQC